jgi:hypothetical protein
MSGCVNAPIITATVIKVCDPLRLQRMMPNLNELIGGVIGDISYSNGVLEIRIIDRDGDLKVLTIDADGEKLYIELKQEELNPFG